jgi:hypothetical protein
MPIPDTDDPREIFEHFSSEYAQALQAYKTIEQKASTLLMMGYTDDLRQFIDQFIEMATRTKAEAESRNETNFAEWFEELRSKAEKLRDGVPQ